MPEIDGELLKWGWRWPNPSNGVSICHACGKRFRGEHRSNFDATAKLLSHIYYEHPEHPIAASISRKDKGELDMDKDAFERQPETAIEAEKKAALSHLELRAKKCELCGLHKTRTNAVFGGGSATARVMIVGEAPGSFEDAQGAPFVGAAGKNLNELLHEAGLKRKDVYICNVLKCRPPGNRPPLPDEIEACRAFLDGQISAVKPEFVVALGRTAARTLLGRDVVMGRDHGALLDCTCAGAKFKLFVTYHPAAALYDRTGAGQRLLADFQKLDRDVRKWRK